MALTLKELMVAQLPTVYSTNFFGEVIEYRPYRKDAREVTANVFREEAVAITIEDSEERQDRRAKISVPGSSLVGCQDDWYGDEFVFDETTWKLAGKPATTVDNIHVDLSLVSVRRRKVGRAYRDVS